MMSYLRHRRVTTTRGSFRTTKRRSIRYPTVRSSVPTRERLPAKGRVIRYIVKGVTIVVIVMCVSF